MAIYKSENGKAPSGLSVGDEVVTGGGTYRITGKNADGTYQSTLSNKAQTTYNYKGQYTTRNSPITTQGVSGYTQSRVNALEGGYTPSQSVQQAQAYLNQVQANKPGAYESQWDGELTELYNNIKNRKKFSYDLGTDPTYQQYREQYQRQGRLAMQDTMGQAAALTGGYGSTYGEQVGQQAYNAYLQSLNDIVPDLYSAAYNRYQDEGTALYNQYSLLSDRENAAYNRYRDSVSDYYSDLSDARSAYNNAYNNDYSQWEYQLNYWSDKANDENTAYLQQLAAASKAGSGSGGSGGSGGSSSDTGTQSTASYKGYIDNTYNKGGIGGIQSKTYDQLKRGMYEWIAQGNPEKAYELFTGIAHQLNLSSSTGKKQYNELAGILNKAGYGIPLEE